MSTILIVDDDADLRNLIAQKLTGAGYETVEAPSVPEAVKILGSIRPHLILLDLMMPGGHGTELIGHLEKLKMEDVPVIVLTNVTTGSYQSRISDYLIKSDMSLDDVVQKVRHTLGH